MNTDPLSDGKIIEAWKQNASPWTNAVRAGEIESRRSVTDRAILVLQDIRHVAGTHGDQRLDAARAARATRPANRQAGIRHVSRASE
jgi:hypothetical protein